MRKFITALAGAFILMSTAGLSYADTAAHDSSVNQVECTTADNFTVALQENVVQSMPDATINAAANLFGAAYDELFKAMGSDPAEMHAAGIDEVVVYTATSKSRGMAPVVKVVAFSKGCATGGSTFIPLEVFQAVMKSASN